MSVENQIHDYHSIVFIAEVDYVQLKVVRNIIYGVRKMYTSKSNSNRMYPPYISHIISISNFCFVFITSENNYCANAWEISISINNRIE